uniref:Twisted gastrulation BMP signaling modulator 1a n=1 Tax=Cyprinus carpio TaxID=7962 RepID=A0A8C2KP77_CYPCA
MFFVSLGGFLLTLTAERSRRFLQDSWLSVAHVFGARLPSRHVIFPPVCLPFVMYILFVCVCVCVQGLCQCRPSEGNCSCCKECMLCLSSLWEECCDCVGMCNPRNYSDSPATSKSTVEELYRPIPSLFRALTEGDAPINMMVVSFPVAEELSHHENLVSFLETLDSQSHKISLPGSSSIHDGAYLGEKILKHDFILFQNTKDD